MRATQKKPHTGEAWRGPCAVAPGARGRHRRCTGGRRAQTTAAMPLRARSQCRSRHHLTARDKTQTAKGRFKRSQHTYTHTHTHTQTCTYMHAHTHPRARHRLRVNIPALDLVHRQREMAPGVWTHQSRTVIQRIIHATAAAITTRAGTHRTRESVMAQSVACDASERMLSLYAAFADSIGSPASQHGPVKPANRWIHTHEIYAAAAAAHRGTAQ
jgi:hypothetical protein